MNPFKNKRFLALKREWYQKLKESGFEDAEDERGLLRECHSFRFNIEVPRKKQMALSEGTRFSGLELQLEQRATYFRLAGAFLHSHCFQNETEKTIWELHSDGRSMREIANIVSEKTPMYTDKVKVTIHRLRDRMLGKDETE